MTNSDRLMLIVLRGISGSGKSTVAKKMQQDIPNTIIISRDDLRLALYNVDFGPPVDEKFITAAEINLSSLAFRYGLNVISDNTNLIPIYLRDRFELARSHGASIILQEVETSLEIAKSNNSARGMNGGRFVPEHVIDKQHELFYEHRDEIRQLYEAFTEND